MKINHNLTDADISRIIMMAWEDRTSFDAIEEQFGLNPGEVIKLMRREMKASSFSDDTEMEKLLTPFAGHRFRVLHMIMQSGTKPPRYGPKCEATVGRTALDSQWLDGLFQQPRFVISELLPAGQTTPGTKPRLALADSISRANVRSPSTDSIMTGV